MQQIATLLRRFRRDERGVFIVIFALMAIVLIATSGAVVDFSSMQQSRTRAQTALDAAALALQVQISSQTNDQLAVKAKTMLDEQIANSAVAVVIDDVEKNVGEGRLQIEATITVETAFVRLVGINTITAHLISEVKQASNDLEVSVSLDVTGSMAGTKIADLIDATNTLIDLVVQDSQTPTYSKMAIVPWSYAVNVGSTYANNVRGTPTGGVSISAVTWTTGTAKSISGITRANPGVITVTNVTSLANGDWVYVSGVSGMTQINGKIGQIASLNTTAKTFRLNVGGSNLCTTSGCGYSSYSSGGTVTKCLTDSCQEVVTTSSAHGLSTGQYAYVSGVSGMSSFSSATWQVRMLTSTTYAAVGSSPSNGIRTSGGTSYCAQYGCTYYYFQNASGGYNLYQINNCATERTTNAYTDAAPSTTYLGKNYRSSGADCITQTIVPLSTNKTSLHALANSLTATGSTAGHIGLAWGWYMIAPNFAYLWPTASQPAAYGTANLVKAVIFMTDGAFNTPYCNGVIASDALSGSGSGSSHNSCASPNGASKAQAEELCDAIKTPSNDTLLYTVGFDLAGDADALAFLESCATSTGRFYQADSGDDLEAAFADIAGELSDLRISK